jgi:hypothetical protein
MGRSAAVILFIGAVAAVALYCAQRPTIAHGDAIAAQLVEANPLLERLDCDDRIPIGVEGALFACHAHFKNGDQADYRLKLDREGHFDVVDQSNQKAGPRIKKTSDPWGD